MTSGSFPRAPRWAVGSALALCLCAALAGCAKDPPGRDGDKDSKPAPEGDPQAAAKVVKDMLAALRAHDCGTLMPLLGEQVAARLRGKSCEEAIAGERLSRMEARVGEARRDGRDPRAFMVPVRLGPAPDAELVLLRVEVSNGEYRVVAM